VRSALSVAAEVATVRALPGIGLRGSEEGRRAVEPTSLGSTMPTGIFDPAAVWLAVPWLPSAVKESGASSYERCWGFLRCGGRAPYTGRADPRSALGMYVPCVALPRSTPETRSVGGVPAGGFLPSEG
jgi:hypothetical protein